MGACTIARVERKSESPGKDITGPCIAFGSPRTEELFQRERRLERLGFGRAGEESDDFLYLKIY